MLLDFVISKHQRMSSIKSYLSQKMTKEVIGALVLLMMVIVPALSFAKSGHKVYVDDNASGTQDGSSDHPYKTITEGLKHAKKNDEVHVRAGSYKENITIKEDRKLYGSGRDKVTITANDDDVPVVMMEDDTKIDGVTVRKGRNGIEIERNAKVSIVNCTVKDNDRDGIRIRKHNKVDTKNAVSIDNTVIKNNGKFGIYSEAHRVVITDSDITDNDKDGVFLLSGSSAWLSGNSIKKNDGSGMKLILDGSNIWTKSNSIADNKREGIEVNAYGGTGRIDIKKSKIHGNDRYGIARVKRGTFSNSIFNGLTVQTDTEYWDNASGNLSHIILVN